MATCGNMSAFSLNRIHRLLIVSRATNGTIKQCIRCSPYTQRLQMSTASDRNSNDEPIRFSTSNAHEHRPFDTFFIKRSPPRYQSLSLLGSVAVFLAYFMFIREENDLDEELSVSIYERVPGLREKDLLGRIQYAEIHGNDTTELYRELNEFRQSHK